jgi:quinol monooxygenase YgiN
MPVRHAMVRIAVALHAPEGRAREIVEAFRYVLVSTLLEPGCLGGSAWADPDSSVHVVEEWATEEDVRRHVRSDRFTSFLSVLESAAERPHVQFDFVTTTRGLDYVAEIRKDVPR